MRDLESFLDHRIIVGHGVDFDLAILNRARRARDLPALGDAVAAGRVLLQLLPHGV